MFNKLSGLIHWRILSSAHLRLTSSPRLELDALPFSVSGLGPIWWNLLYSFPFGFPSIQFCDVSLLLVLHMGLRQSSHSWSALHLRGLAFPPLLLWLILLFTLCHCLRFPLLSHHNQNSMFFIPIHPQHFKTDPLPEFCFSLPGPRASLHSGEMIRLATVFFFISLFYSRT